MLIFENAIPKTKEEYFGTYGDKISTMWEPKDINKDPVSC